MAGGGGDNETFLKRKGGKAGLCVTGQPSANDPVFTHLSHRLLSEGLSSHVNHLFQQLLFSGCLHRTSKEKEKNLK